MEEFLKSLGLDPNQRYSPEEIKKAWKKKANEHHPDKGGKVEAFLEVTHAYKMLTDPSYRHQEARKAKPQGPDLHVRMQVPVLFEEAFFGREISISYNRLEIGEDSQPIQKVEQELIYVHFKLPRGCMDGHQIIKTGYGLKKGNEFGDLFIQVVPRRHAKFQHNGPDILSQEKIPLDMLLKGGEMEVQTMHGLRTLKIPPGTQPGEKLTIRKCGVGGFGNHIVIVDPVFPQKNDLKNEAWKGLDINWSIEEESEDERFETIFINLRGTNVNGDNFP